MYSMGYFYQNSQSDLRTVFLTAQPPKVAPPPGSPGEMLEKYQNTRNWKISPSRLKLWYTLPTHLPRPSSQPTFPTFPRKSDVWSTWWPQQDWCRPSSVCTNRKSSYSKMLPLVHCTFAHSIELLRLSGTTRDIVQTTGLSVLPTGTGSCHLIWNAQKLIESGKKYEQSKHPYLAQIQVSK